MSIIETSVTFRTDRRWIFEAEFKKTGWYKMHVESDDTDKVDMFERHPEEGWYYSPLVDLAWEFYELGAK